MKTLTEQEQIVLDAIKAFIKEHGYSPSYKELTEITPVKSTSTISWHLDMLKIKGYITFTTGRARTIKVVEKEKDKWNELKRWLEEEKPTEDMNENFIMIRLSDLKEKMQELEGNNE